MLSSIRQKVTSTATFLGTTAACAGLMFGVYSRVIPDQFKSSDWQKFPAAGASLLVSCLSLARWVAHNKQKNSQYKQSPLPSSKPDSRVDEINLDAIKATKIVWPEKADLMKTKSFLIIPEGYPASTLASEPFRQAIKRYQEFLQTHFPTELITVGIAYPEQSISSVIPDSKYGHKNSTWHPLLQHADRILILLNGEIYPLSPHANSVSRTAVSWGPSVTGIADFEMLSTALHECLHLCSVSQNNVILDSYSNEYHKLSLWSKSINAFEHSGFLPHVPETEWPDTLVTRAIKNLMCPNFLIWKMINSIGLLGIVQM